MRNNKHKVWAIGLVLTLLPVIALPLVMASQANPVFAETVLAAGEECGGNPNYVYKNGTCMPKPVVTGGFTESETIQDFIIKVVKILLLLAGAIAVVFIIIGGYRYITSGGNEETAEKGKNTLVNALIGLVVAILAYAIIQVVTNLVTGGK